MLLDSLGFMAFSNFESFAWCALCLYIFRFNAKDYVWESLFVITFMNLQSYVLRNEFALAYLVPIINILFLTLLFATVVKVSLIGSLSMTIVGFVGFAVIQTLIALILFGSIHRAQETTINGYILQSTTAAIVLPLSWLLYRYGHGFSFDFDRFRLRFERAAVITTIIIFLIAVPAVLYVNEIWINILFFVVSLLFFLRYAIRKEREL